MMKLKDFIPEEHKLLINKDDGHIDIQSIDDDSRKVALSSLFVVLKGNHLDGADFVGDAIKKGARVIVSDQEIEQSKKVNNVCYLTVGSARDFLKKSLVNFYGHPSQKVGVIGVTGTNGKTTVTFLVSAILNAARFKTAVIGTIHYKMADQIIPSSNTTPGLVDNHKFLSQLEKQDIDFCVMEVSSHALDQGRTDLIDFRCGVFTNLTSDHLDYHKTREQYFQAKSLLFTKLAKSASAIINVDDEYGIKLVMMTKAKVLTYGINSQCDFKALNIHLSLSGSRFDLVYPNGQIQIKTKLFGIHNIYNLLAAIAASFSQGINIKNIQEGIESLEYVPGRLERVDAGQEFSVFIDYAHTQDAMLNLLQTIKRSSPSRIILVFGCGGDRDKNKRPKMGEVASKFADFSIVTSDNPRSEDPQSIIDQVVEGFENANYTVIVNRQEAIEKALSMAKVKDIVLIAGKGHETYQIFKDKTIAFNEREIVTKFIKCLQLKKS